MTGVVDELEKVGIDSSYIKILKKEGYKRLTPTQQDAINRGILSGQSALICAPTTSGKTLLAELCALKALSTLKRVFYVVSHKAIAEEKFDDFLHKYGEKVDIVISTRNHTVYDKKILSQDFGIAIIIAEKLHQFITIKPDLLSLCGLVVLDEIQMIHDPQRGYIVELLLTRLRKYIKEGVQLLGLSSPLEGLHKLALWLGVKFLKYHHRPVELRMGVLFEGDFEYINYNTAKRGLEKFKIPPGTSHGEIARELMLYFAEKGEQTIYFMPTREATRTVAGELARILNERFPHGKIDKDLVLELEMLEDSQSKELLLTSLSSRVAFHNADLSPRERLLVERLLREGKVVLLCATTTLALGVNLPAQNVIIHPLLFRKSQRRSELTFLRKSEYDSMAGRAGRLGWNHDFGRAILIAENESQKDALWNRFIGSPGEELRPAIASADPAEILLNIAAEKANRTGYERPIRLEEIKNELEQTFSFYMGERKFLAALGDALKKCTKIGLIEGHEEALQLTSFGKAFALGGLSVDSAETVKRWLESAKERSICPEEIIYTACRTPDGHDAYIHLATKDCPDELYQEYPKILSKFLPLEVLRLYEEFSKSMLPSFYHIYAMKMTAMLIEWMEGREVRSIESKYNNLSGHIIKAAEQISWIIGALALCAEAFLIKDKDLILEQWIVSSMV